MAIDNLASRLWFTEPGDPASIVNVTGVGILNPAALDQDAIRLRRLYGVRSGAELLRREHL